MPGNYCHFTQCASGLHSHWRDGAYTKRWQFLSLVTEEWPQCTSKENTSRTKGIVGNPTPKSPTLYDSHHLWQNAGIALFKILTTFPLNSAPAYLCLVFRRTGYLSDFCVPHSLDIVGLRMTHLILFWNLQTFLHHKTPAKKKAVQFMVLSSECFGNS